MTAAADREILRFARRWVDRPGSNLRASGRPMTWAYLRRQLEVERAVVIGLPDRWTVEVLATLAEEIVLVAGRSQRQLRQAQAIVAEVGAARIAPRDGLAELLVGPTTLASVAGVDGSEDWGQLAPLLRGLVESGGCAHIDLTLSPQVRKTVGDLARRAYRLVPAHQAEPTGQDGPVSEGLTAVFVRRPIRTGDGAELVVVPTAEATAGRDDDAMVLLPHHSDPSQVPEWIRVSAASAGLELEARPWSLRPPRGYASQKMVFNLTRPNGARVVVKVGQAPRFNPLLENELEGLQALERVRGGAIGAPVPVFSGSCAGLAMVGESFVPGEAFSGLGPAERQAARSEVVDALLELATSTRSTSPPGDVAVALLDLVDRLAEGGALTVREITALRGELEVIGATNAPFPVVFAHGDPSPFNLLREPSGHLHLVDFERSEVEGMPLWDIWYFLQASAPVARPLRTRLVGRRTLPLSGAGEADLLPVVGRRACVALDLDPGLVTPLFFAFWVSLALREASRHAGAGGRHATTLRGYLRSDRASLSALLVGPG